MLGEAGSGSLVPASRWSTATPGETGVDDGDGDNDAELLHPGLELGWVPPIELLETPNGVGQVGPLAGFGHVGDSTCCAVQRV